MQRKKRGFEPFLYCSCFDEKSWWNEEDVAVPDTDCEGYDGSVRLVLVRRRIEAVLTLMQARPLDHV